MENIPDSASLRRGPKGFVMLASVVVVCILALCVVFAPQLLELRDQYVALREQTEVAQQRLTEAAQLDTDVVWNTRTGWNVKVYAPLPEAASREASAFQIANIVRPTLQDAEQVTVVFLGRSRSESSDRVQTIHSYTFTY